MPSLTPPPPRPPALSVAIVLHVLLGVIYAVMPFFVIGGVSIGGIAVTASEGFEDAFPVLLLLGLVGLGSLLFGVMGLISLIVSYKAWRMSHVGIWALMIWSVVHLSSGCGLLVTILTLVGGVQALERRAEASADRAA